LGRVVLLSNYQGRDASLPRDLARRPPVSVAGRRDRAERRVFAAVGAGAELRMVVRDSRGVWGLLGLLRADDRRPFDRQDTIMATQLIPPLAAVLRGVVTASPLRTSAPALLPGVMIIGADHRVRATTGQAREWLTELHKPGRYGPPEWAIEGFMMGMSLAARRAARDATAPAPMVCCPVACFGRWVTVQGQPLDDGGAGDVAIVIQSAAGHLLLPSFCDWYGITARERQVVERLYTGAPPKQVAHAMDISLNTVNEHLKVVFRKTGCSGRDELMAALTA
jgi:DNA-binding CsgD family transcriptional regulator